MFKKLGSKRSIAVVSADIEWCPYHPENILLSNEPDRDLLLVEFIGNVDSKQFFDKYGKFMDEHGRLTDTYGYDPSKNCG
ncbi:MAG: hypothetical protein NTW30_02660, partial [Candidatus Aenigmarchaeota archaeon]|nr:hypothetical protein [Candidatus Aenigmarchaeota archaeon]